jgi:hypothetical protein
MIKSISITANFCLAPSAVREPITTGNWIVMVEMHPELAVAIGRHFQAGNRNRVNAGFVDAHQDRARSGDDTQHFHAQGRHQAALRRHNHWHAPDDAVTFGID